MYVLPVLYLYLHMTKTEVSDCSIQLGIGRVYLVKLPEMYK